MFKLRVWRQLLTTKPVTARHAGERTLTDRERTLGGTHPDTLTSRNNLANAYRAAGRLEEAEGLQNRAEPND